MKIKMKKVLCALFAIILVCTGLSACGKSPCYAKITYSDGSSEMLDMKNFVLCIIKINMHITKNIVEIKLRQLIE